MRQTITLVLFACFAVMQVNAQTTTQPQPMPGFSEKDMKKMKPSNGIKVGYNYAMLKGSTKGFSPSSTNGFMVGAFFSPKKSKGLGYRSEIVFSRQGFSFDESGKMQDVTQDYIYMTHLTTYTIADRVQLQLGGQFGYLLNAKKSSAPAGSSDAMMEYMNRFDYGLVGGVEVKIISGLFIGARYNVSMGNMFKNSTSNPTQMPFPLPYNPADIKGKNAVAQFFIGFKF